MLGHVIINREMPRHCGASLRSYFTAYINDSGHVCTVLFVLFDEMVI